MNTIMYIKEELKHFINDNEKIFNQKLLTEATNVSTKITDILTKGNIDLLKNAKKLIFTQ